MRVFGSWCGWDEAERPLIEALGEDTVGRLAEAYRFAARAHGGQRRPAGEPYVTHLLEVVEILVVVGLRDRDVLSAGLLHDVVEDTACSAAEVEAAFGSGVAELLGWLTAPEPAAGESTAAVRHTYLSSFAEAPSEVLAVKLADRYSNIQRLDTHPRPAKQRSYYRETVRYFVPLAAGVESFDELFAVWRERYAYLADEDR